MKRMLIIIQGFEEFFLSYCCHVHFFTITVLNLSVQSSTYPVSPQFISVFSPQLFRLVLKLSVQSSTYPSVLNLSVQSLIYPVSSRIIRSVLNLSV
jgi:hypothetical protein